ncbi:hypothetical protein LJC38_07180, partial [Parabacteroides sp. OttesenSCG-928-K15]|nr:hypothetical protein [Parabacteroides sp. OttesenSCG-928-K15]
DVQKTTFITAVNETWSNKHGLNTTVTRYKKDKRNLWQEKLNSVKVDVAVLPTANVDDAFFKITHNDSDYGSAVWPHQGEDAPAAFAALSQGGYIETLTAMNKDIPAGATNNIANPRSYNVFAHEAGHMFGLDDEYQIDNAGFKERIITEGSHSYDSNNGDFYNYVNNYWRILPAGTLEFWHDPSNSWHPYAGPALSGTPTRHQNIVPRAVVPGIADAVMDNNRTDNSIMGDGYQVHERHYVTFLKALLQSIQGAGLETDKAPVKEEDWKIGN